MIEARSGWPVHRGRSYASLGSRPQNSVAEGSKRNGNTACMFDSLRKFDFEQRGHVLEARVLKGEKKKEN